MQWLEILDRTVFRFINQTSSNPVFDVMMPFLSGNRYTIPVVVLIGLAGLWLMWKDRPRGMLCVMMLVLIIGPGDKYITNQIKHAIGRPRPFVAMPETRLPAGPNGRVGMPSSHAANWGAAAMIMFLYYRRSLWLVLPLGLVVSYSRVYNGVHYPGDVLAGFLLGATYAFILVRALDAVWRFLARKYCPKWLERLPTLIPATSTPPGNAAPVPGS